MTYQRPPRRYSRDPRLTSDQQRAFSRSMNQSFNANWQSDAASNAIAGLTLIISFSLTARAISINDLAVGYVIAPFIIEYLLILWLGTLLTRTVVKEAIFQQISSSLLIALGWTIALLTPYLIVLSWNDGFGVDNIFTQLPQIWETLLTSGMVWPCVVVSIALLVETAKDVMVWRKRRGPFVWPATHRFSFRFVALLGTIFALPFTLWAIAAVGELLGHDPFYSGLPLTWIAFAMLLSADALVLTVGTWAHRRALTRNRQKTPDRAGSVDG